MEIGKYDLTEFLNSDYGEFIYIKNSVALFFKINGLLCLNYKNYNLK